MLIAFVLAVVFAPLMSIDPKLVDNPPTREEVLKSIEVKSVELDDFPDKPKVGILFANPLKDSDANTPDKKLDDQEQKDSQKPAVLFLTGWTGSPAGVSYYTAMASYTAMAKKPERDFSLLQAQWPGATSSLEDGTLEVKSDEIDKSAYSDIGKYYAALFKSLKSKHEGKLHVCAWSNGAFEALLGYLSMNKNDREGISLSLVDIFIPSDFFSQYRIPGWLLRLVNFISPSYKNDLTDIVFMPFTLFGRFVVSLVNQIYIGIFRANAAEVHPNLIDFLIDFKLEIKHPIHKILRCYQNQKKMWEMLAKEPDGSLDIKQIAVLTSLARTDIPDGPDGFGSRPSYVELLKKKLLPKVKPIKNPDGTESPVKPESFAFSHNRFVGNDKFYLWMSRGLKPLPAEVVTKT